MKINLFNGETLKFDASSGHIKFPKTDITISMQVESLNQQLSQLAQFITSSVKMKKRTAIILQEKSFT